ncbi:hypothetical protein J1N35_041411 [Gossypium stocksii]|uniref:MULE transposase domain-containing protein n=1 Tax=Gossypium stocksii TaxID=47602 RepID=A0A9D3UHA9_9ROSI|nr:hypothetical protein J1N35_041411 [Gossypium stocksii]
MEKQRMDLVEGPVAVKMSLNVHVYAVQMRIIGLDECWLKGYYGGHLLAVVGVDANDCIYPVAFAVVESENKQSWFWFLELLHRDLEIDNSYNICFMS